MQTYKIKSNSGKVIFTASLPNKTLKSKLPKLAVEQAIKAGVILYNADLFSADLSHANLSHANLSNANLYGANLSDANLSGADLSGINFTGADLSYANLSGVDLCWADLRHANLTGANFTDADLCGADFEHAILKDAILPDGVPYIPNLDKLIYEALQLPERKLDMENWHHPCNTTHCRYGWAIHLAGEAGYALEEKFESETAGALIYAKAYPELPIPPYTEDNAEVMADIKMRAGV